MNTRVKLFVWGLLIVVVAGSMAAIVVKQNEVAALRAEQQMLLNDSQETDRLTRENSGIEKLRQENEEVAKLRVENKDLPKLRNEVRQLRKQLDEMAKLRAENQRLSAQPANSPNQTRSNVFEMVFQKDSLRDRGLGLPMLTLQTFFAALSHGNVDRALECLTPETAAKLQTASADDRRQKMLQLMDGFTGFQISERSQPAPDEIVLRVELPGTGATQQIYFKQIGNEWNIAQ